MFLPAFFSRLNLDEIATKTELKTKTGGPEFSCFCEGAVREMSFFMLRCEACNHASARNLRSAKKIADCLF
jgi:hypothetical protein